MAGKEMLPREVFQLRDELAEWVVSAVFKKSETADDCLNKEEMQQLARDVADELLREGWVEGKPYMAPASQAF